MNGLYQRKGRPASSKRDYGRIRVLRVPPSGWPAGFACLLEVSMAGLFMSRSRAVSCWPRRLSTRKAQGPSLASVGPGHVR